MEKEKLKWLSDIGAVAYPEPVKYIYKFPEGHETFTLTERYIEEAPLSELKAEYERNRQMAEEAIRWKRLREQNRLSYYGHPGKDLSNEVKKCLNELLPDRYDL